MKMVDKLEKINKKKTPGLVVIQALKIQDVFYDWLKKFDPLLERIYSLKRLANIFLADYPSYYFEYQKKVESFDEIIRVAKTPWLED